MLSKSLDFYVKAAILLILGLTCFRLYYATTFELVADEAYYWLWSKHLDMSYFSKGPGVAWTIAFGTFLLDDTVLGIRFFSILLAAGTGTWLFFLAKSCFDSKTAFWSVATAASIPLFAVGSVLMTIDPLSVFFWVIAATSFWKASQTSPKSPSYGYWILTGLFVGAGTLCKYTNLVQLLCFLIFCLWSSPHRLFLRKLPFWTMTGTAFLCQLPVLLWNAQNQWITFQHLWHRGSLDKSWRFSPREFFQFVTEQAAVISPLLFIAILIAVIYALRISFNSNVTRQLTVYRYLLSLFLPLFLFYLILSMNESGEANWTAPCYVAGILLVVAVAWEWINQYPSKKWISKLALTCLLFAFLQTGLLQFNALSLLELPPGKDPMDRVRGSRNLATQLVDLQEKHQTSFFIFNKYGYASLMTFYFPNHPRHYIPTSHKIENQYSFWPNYLSSPKSFQGKSALFVFEGKEAEIPDPFHHEFEKITFLKETFSEENGRKVRKFYIYLCHNLKAPALTSISNNNLPTH